MSWTIYADHSGPFGSRQRWRAAAALSCIRFERPPHYLHRRAPSESRRVTPVYKCLRISPGAQETQKRQRSEVRNWAYVAQHKSNVSQWIGDEACVFQRFKNLVPPLAPKVALRKGGVVHYGRRGAGGQESGVRVRVRAGPRRRTENGGRSCFSIGSLAGGALHPPGPLCEGGKVGGVTFARSRRFDRIRGSAATSLAPHPSLAGGTLHPPGPLQGAKSGRGRFRSLAAFRSDQRLGCDIACASPPPDAGLLKSGPC